MFDLVWLLSFVGDDDCIRMVMEADDELLYQSIQNVLHSMLLSSFTFAL